MNWKIWSHLLEHEQELDTIDIDSGRKNHMNVENGFTSLHSKTINWPTQEQ